MEKSKATPTPQPPTPIKREGEIRSRARDGFLPFYTNAFDRFFISAVILIGIHLLWLRFMEPPLPAPTQNLWLPMVISLMIGYIVVRRG